MSIALPCCIKTLFIELKKGEKGVIILLKHFCHHINHSLLLGLVYVSEVLCSRFGVSLFFTVCSNLFQFTLSKCASLCVVYDYCA